MDLLETVNQRLLGGRKIGRELEEWGLQVWEWLEYYIWWLGDLRWVETRVRVEGLSGKNRRRGEDGVEGALLR